uniref:Protein kinase-like domain, concanavalin A-like lectin/glucanase domain protein n=1 Tax=Tanacetum cinerariifolium TaxID=118510 RepID=A0A6L2JVM6_TANCI|nr:protein kinase-like domain, concanavalin A-like lectin/glucanase domain protein [Tanacetum cinerariifolium]
MAWPQATNDTSDRFLGIKVLPQGSNRLGIHSRDTPTNEKNHARISSFQINVQKQCVAGKKNDPKAKHGTLGWLLESTHVTWAYLKKKWRRLRLYTKSLEEIRTQCVETALRLLATTSNHTRDGVRKFKTASECSRLKRSPRRISKAMAAEDLRRYPATKAIETPLSTPYGNNVVPLRSNTIRTAKLQNDTLMFQQHQVNLFLKHGIVSRTYSKKSLIMASIFGFKSKSFITMSIPPQGEPSISQPVDNDHNRPVSIKEKVIEETKELGEETEGETKEEEEDDPEYFDTFPTVKELRYHKWLLKNPRPPGPMPRVMGLKIFVGNFTYECDFVMLEDTSSVIDPYLGGIVLGKPFTKVTRLICDKDEGTITFEIDKGKITFKIPQKMERFKRIDKDILKTDNILPFLITGDDNDHAKTHS